MSLHSFETWLFEMLDRPIACTSSSTRRVDTPRIHVTEDGAWPIIFYDRRVTCWQPHVKGWTVMVNSIFKLAHGRRLARQVSRPGTAAPGRQR